MLTPYFSRSDTNGFNQVDQRSMFDEMNLFLLYFGEGSFKSGHSWLDCCGATYHVTASRTTSAMMHAVKRCCTSALRAAKPAFLTQRANSTALRCTAAYQTSSKLYCRDLSQCISQVNLLPKLTLTKSPRADSLAALSVSLSNIWWNLAWYNDGQHYIFKPCFVDILQQCDLQIMSIL